MATLRKLLICQVLALLLAACAANWPTPTLETGDAATPMGSRITGLAQGLLGVPYRYGGESPQGFDCSGLVYYIHERLGLDVPRTADSQFEAVQPVPVRELVPGDLVFFQLATAKASHVGIYVGDGRFIHAPSSGGEVEYARLADEWWWSRFLGAGRLY
ncbi:MAG TPA: C40 family peptidase [Gammaproteobacteria bacterium]|nr:C40 family peptidase [Gammaproteobacteria bacterium]